MVGFLQSPAIDGAVAEERDDLRTQLLSETKKLSAPNDPLFDLCQPELEEEEEFSTSFCDSLFDFESVGGWLMEGDPEHCGEPDMAGLGGDPVGIGSCVGELAVSNESFGLSGDGICKEVKGEEGLGGNGSGRDKEETERSVEMGPCEKMSLEGFCGGGGPGDTSGDLGCLIEEKLGKVSLVGNIGDGSTMGHSLMGMNGNGMKVDETVSDEDKSDNNVKSEGESSSASSSSSSSSDSSSSSGGEEEDEDKDGGALSGEKKAKNEEDSDVEEQSDAEEGEIMLSDAEGLVTWSDNEDAEDGSGMTGPIMSKNELKVLPPVPSVSVTLEPHHETLPVGVILSIVGAQVIVEGVEKHNPLNEGSILWITESRLPLGIIEEIFGPVKNPYYIVRYNSESEVPVGIEQGTLVSFVQEFAGHVLNDKSLYQKGYDASGENDEELSDELEFSDDEKEAEYRRMLKMKKRGTNESNPGVKRNEKRQQKNRTGNWNRNRDPGDKIPGNQDQHFVPPVAASLNQDKFSCSSGPGREWAGNQALVPQFPHGPQAPGFAPCSSGPRPDLASNQAMGPPFPHGPQAPVFVPCSSGPRPDLAGNQSMVPPFPQGPQAPGFGPPNGIWSNNGFPHQQQQSIGLSNGLPPNSMLWMQQNGPFPLFQTPLQMSMAFQQLPGLPFNFNAVSGQPNFVGGPMLAPWSMGLDQNALNASQFGMGLQGQDASMPPLNGGGEQQGGQTQGPQDNRNTRNENLNFNQGRGRGGGGGRRGYQRGRGRGHFGGGRGRHQSR